MENGSLSVCKEKGLVKSEGKEYVMKDGDIVEFDSMSDYLITIFLYSI